MAEVVKAIRLPKRLFSYNYSNGNMIEVTNIGITIWDRRVGRWVIDASLLEEDNKIRLAETGYKFRIPKEMSSLYKDSQKGNHMAKKKVVKKKVAKKSARSKKVSKRKK